MRICGFLTCVCLQVYSSASPLRLGPQRVGLAFASVAASGCKPGYTRGVLGFTFFTLSSEQISKAGPCPPFEIKSSNLQN